MTVTLYKGDKTCQAEEKQVSAMVKAGWSRSNDQEMDMLLGEAHNEPTEEVEEAEDTFEKLIEVEPVEEQVEEESEEIPGVDFSKMNKKELLVAAEEAGYEVDSSWKVAELRELLAGE